MPTNIKQTDPAKKYRKVLAGSTLTGDIVRNSAGERLGEIQDIMIDIPSGRIAYAVLAFDVGQKLFAVPWNNLTVDEDQQCFILAADKQKLETAPGFDRNNWPDVADSSCGATVFHHYTPVPYYI